MRLLYVCNDFGIVPSGTKGASVHLRAITRAIAERGHEVVLLCPGEGPGQTHPARRLLAPGCPPVRTAVRPLKRWLEARDLDTAAAREMRPLLYNEWALRAGLEALCTRRPDAIVERLALMSHLGLDLAEALDVPLVVEVNALMTEESDRFRSVHAAGLAQAIERRVLERADALVVVSRDLAERLAATGIDAGNITVVPNGVDPARFSERANRSAMRQALGLSDAFVIGFAGSLKCWHGVDVLIEAFGRMIADVPAARLLIVGSGPMEASLRSQAARLGVHDQVVFTGAVDHHRIPGLLAGMDVAVAPFKRIEKFYFSPIKLFEYMAAGVCTVASRIGQIKDVLTDGRTGLLCPADDAASLATALVRTYRAPALRQRVALAALALVRNRFTWAHAAASTIQVVQRAIDHRTAEASGPGAGHAMEAVV